MISPLMIKLFGEGRAGSYFHPQNCHILVFLTARVTFSRIWQFRGPVFATSSFLVQDSHKTRGYGSFSLGFLPYPRFRGSGCRKNEDVAKGTLGGWVMGVWSLDAGPAAGAGACRNAGPAGCSGHAGRAKARDEARGAADIRRVAETVGAGASRGCGRGREPELGELARAEAGAMDTRRERPVWARDLGPWAPSAGRDGERGLPGRWRRGFRKNPAVFASFPVGNTSLATMAQLHGNERKCHVPPGI